MLFPLCYVCFQFQSVRLCFVLFYFIYYIYYIILYYIYIIYYIIILWNVACFQKADKKGVDVDGTEGVEELEVTEGGKTEISKYYVRKIYIQ